MIVCVSQPRSQENALAIRKTVMAIVNETGRGSLLEGVKHAITSCAYYPWTIQDNFPVVAEAEAATPVIALTMKDSLVEGLKEVLGQQRPKHTPVSSSFQS